MRINGGLETYCVRTPSMISHASLDGTLCGSAWQPSDPIGAARPYREKRSVPTRGEKRRPPSIGTASCALRPSWCRRQQKINCSFRGFGSHEKYCATERESKKIGLLLFRSFFANQQRPPLTLRLQPSSRLSANALLRRSSRTTANRLRRSHTCHLLSLH